MISSIRNGIVSVLLLLINISVHAQENAKPALYLAQKGDVSLYLVGSIHAGRTNFYPLPSYIEEAFKKSDSLYLEVHPSEMSPEKSQLAMVRYGVLSTPKPFQQRMSADLAAQVLKTIETTQMPANQMVFMKDWLVIIQLTVKTIQQMGLNPEQGVDQHFAKLAKQAKIPVKGLETMEQQFALLASMDEIGAEVLYKDFINELPLAKEWLLSLEQAWRTGDANKLAKLYSEYDGRQHHSEFLKKLTSDRNKNWSRQFAKLAGSQTHMVVVGDMHIHGDQSVLDYLKSEGFKVQRVNK